MAQILETALGLGAPTVAEQYESPELRVLVGICEELQRSAGNNPFYLSCRKAGDLIGTNHVRAWNYLRLLQQDGILATVTVGSYSKKKATRWRYLPAL